MFLFAITALILICESSNSAARAAAGFDSKMSIFRLPKTTKPLNYSLRIIPYYGTSSLFNGTVKISTKIIKESTEILLHSKDLIIDSVYMGCAASFKLDPVNEILRIEACKKLEANRTLELEISYHGFTNGTVGLYKSSYQIGKATK